MRKGLLIIAALATIVLALTQMDISCRRSASANPTDVAMQPNWQAVSETFDLADGDTLIVAFDYSAQEPCLRMWVQDSHKYWIRVQAEQSARTHRNHPVTEINQRGRYHELVIGYRDPAPFHELYRIEVRDKATDKVVSTVFLQQSMLHFGIADVFRDVKSELRHSRNVALSG